MKKWFQIGAILLLGIAIGQFLSRSHEKGQGEGRRSKEEFIFASGELMLGDFESEKDLERWEATNVSAFLSDEHVARGRHSAKLTYGGDQNPTFMMEDFFEKNKKARDWRGYETLVFTLFNPGSSQQRLILQIKDRKDRRYKEDMYIPANNSLSYRVPLEDIASFVDLKEIVQLNFFRWNPKTAAIFFLDDVKLIPKEKKARQEESRLSPELEGAPEPQTPVAASEKEPFGGSITANSPNVVSGLLFQQVAKKWQAVSKTSGETFLQVPIKVASLTATLPDRFPVSGGVPFPYGLLSSTTSFRLMTAEGEELPLQIRPLGFWEDGSIQWLLVDTQLPQGTADKKLFLEIHQTPPPTEPESPLRISEDPSSVTITTGPLQFSVSKKNFTLFQKAFLDLNGDKQFLEDEKVADGGGDLVIRFRGSEYRSSLDAEEYSLKLEERGPLRVTLKASGWFRNAEGKKFCQYNVRIQAFAGKSDVRVYHTFIYTGYPENIYHHEYKDVKGLPENETIEEIAMEHSSPTQKETAYQVGLPTQVLVGKMKGPLLLSQPKQDLFRLSQGTDVIHEGKEASGWVNLSSLSSGTSVFVRDFWQQYPKEILVDVAGKIKISLWPRSAGPLNLETQDAAYGPDAVARGSAFGLGKTHELIFSFHSGVAEPQTLHQTLSAFQHPPILHADPEWVYVSYALGSLGPHQVSVEGEELIARLFDWAARQPKAFGWYGMLDYGDTRFWYRKDAYDKSYPEWGWHPEGRWGWFNCEQVGTHAASLLQFARTGLYKYFSFGEASSRHIMDVDTIHYDTVENDPRLRGKIYSDHSHVGAMHRHNANHWGGRSDEASHTHLLGFLLYYYLTGYERSFDVAKEVGSFYLKNPITYTRHPDIAPQRAIANLLWGETLLYQATRDKRYKEAADRWAALFVEGQREDGSWAKDYNPRADSWPDESDSRFMALHTLPSLITYHRLTGNPRVKEAILKGTDYLIQNEKYLPFFDALAYSYELTGEAKYMEEGRRRLMAQIQAQDRSEDPLRNGMVFGKITYDRVPPLLYTVPYLLGVRNPSFLKPYYEKKEEEIVAKSEAKGLDYEVRIVSPFQRVLRDAPFKGLGHANPIQLSLAANEYESTQIVLSSLAGDLKEVRIQAEDLVNATTGTKIDKKEIVTYPVGYVELRKTQYLPELIGFVPDPLPSKETFDVKRGKLQPIWVTVYAPPGTPAGLYQGSIFIQPKNGPQKKVALEVHIWDFELPKTPRLKTAFDLYTGRLVDGYQNFFPDWWPKWRESISQLEDRYYERMLRYRISPILNIDPARPESIERVKRLLNLGMTSFGIGKYSGSSGNNWPADLTPVVPLYQSYAAILRDHNLLDRSYLYTSDESPAGTEKVARVAEKVHQASPFLRNMVTLMETPMYSSYADWFKDIDIVCLRNVSFDPAQAEEIRKAGKELWIYCSGPSYPYPTFVIDYPMMAYRILPWMCWKYKVTGLLYWCVNFWTVNPYTNPENTKWEQNDNGVLFYPGPEGPVGSIRLELLRDGMEDYDMIAILSDKIARAKAKGSLLAETIQQAETALNDAETLARSMREYPKQPEGLLELRGRIAQAIESLKGAE